MGTAKPDITTYSCPTFLFDIFDTTQEYTAAAWRADVLAAIEKSFEMNRTPIIVGGSVFYIHSLFFPPQELVATTHNRLVDMSLSEDELYNQLCEIDPLRAAALHKHDKYRVRRALEIWNKTGQQPSRFLPTFSFPYLFDFFVILPDELVLQEKISLRSCEMIKQLGWIQECEQLIGTEWHPFALKKGFIGYQEVFDYISDKKTTSIDDLIFLIAKKTWQYARHQRAFCKKTIKSLEGAGCGARVVSLGGK